MYQPRPPSNERKFRVTFSVHKPYKAMLEEALQRHPSISRSDLLRRAIEGGGLAYEIAQLDLDAGLIQAAVSE